MNFVFAFFVILITCFCFTLVCVFGLLFAEFYDLLAQEKADREFERGCDLVADIDRFDS